MAFSNQQLQALWTSHGGSPQSARVAAAIALAESGGDPNSTNVNTDRSVDRGAWQINSVHGSLSTHDPSRNVQAAIQISKNGTDWRPWVTYTTGKYKQFLGPQASQRTAAASAPPSPSLPQVSAPSFDQAGYERAQGLATLGKFVQSQAKSPFDLPGPKANLPSGTGSLFSTGVLTTKAPDPSHYLTAQRDLQQLAGQTQVQPHPAAGEGGQKVQAMTKFANSVLGRPYLFGGGHAAFGTAGGFDCSGFVSAVLHAGGYLSAPTDTTQLPSQAGISAGPGRFVTVYDRAQPGQNGHVIISISGQFYEAGGSAAFGGGGGVKKIPHPPASYLASFPNVLHPNGL